MKRILTKSVGELEYQEVPYPEIKKEEALIEVKSIGICNSDVSPYKGKLQDIMPLPYIPAPLKIRCAVGWLIAISSLSSSSSAK